jgi:endonuclease-3
VLDELVATVLSQHTSDRNSERAFASLKECFPAWEDVIAAPTVAVADAIRMGGIADQKAVRIQRILAIVAEREGRLDLSRLHELDDGAVEAYLTSLPGVGLKTAACVLAFSMGRAAFPVDTHVHRVAARLGWAGTRAPMGQGGAAPPTAAQAHELLRELVPADIRYDLHLALIEHGRRVCAARRPECEVCVICRRCAFGRSRLQ